MPEVNYRIFFDNAKASQQTLEKIEAVTVEQEMDMAWEVRLEIPITLDNNGNWQGDDEDFMRPFCRVRVEIKLGDNPFSALFEGSITGFDSKMSSVPGKSAITLIAQDDTFYLNRVETVAAFEDKADHEIVEQIFNDFGDYIASKQVDKTPVSGTGLEPLVVQRGTTMELLRKLARRQGVHVYLLPGENPGESIGCFKTYPTSGDGLPPLILLGEKRNLDQLKVRYCACMPSDAMASTLKISDKSEVTETVRTSDVQFLGDETAEDSFDADMQILPPFQGESVDLRQAVTAVVNTSSFSYHVEGNILEETYSQALQPYRVITLQAGNTPISGDYLVTKATHKITRAAYSQSFTLKRNARSARFGSGQNSPTGGIF